LRIFSGIQPTGRKHLGNHIGAVRGYLDGQERGDPAIFCIVDLHAITVPYDPARLRSYVYDTLAMLLASGLDPDRSILFRQSDVHEHTELSWLLSAVTAHGDLNRMTQFKEKVAGQRGLVSAGLFLYPVLQAADVLAYRAQEVPVGDDQRQHVELMRDIAVRFNATYGDVLVVPEHRIPDIGARIMDLQDPGSKMSTTGSEERGLIFVDDEEKAILKKVKSAVTDSGGEVRRAADKPGIANLIDVLAVIRDVAPQDIEREFDGQGYGAFKGAVAESVVDYLRPVRERYRDLRSDEQALEHALGAGADRARSLAIETLADVRRAMGVGPPA